MIACVSCRGESQLELADYVGEKKIILCGRCATKLTYILLQKLTALYHGLMLAQGNKTLELYPPSNFTKYPKPVKIFTNITEVDVNV